MESISVFCGSRCGDNPIFSSAASQLGTLIANKKIKLIYGAGNIGLMGVIADACLAASGHVIGVIPTKLVDKEVAHKGLTEIFIVDSMHERKALMASKSDAFIALPGGFGTCDELFEILTWAQLGIHHNPIGILNTEGFFDPLLVWIDQMIGQGFVKPKFRELLLVASKPEDLLALILQGAKLKELDIDLTP
ncbi:MAG: TIGR00730 family Rossman fold protein [Gemmataceae bacterium]|nr:TIGR00730 family Rossman fold protein [Gemmataceae bacterium]MBJ7345010.1 TIGR00730 family Rossman fold protein [Gemmataceae bacterium]MBJ7429795.1 TIGR00730 family Rossman fold protein [Gemmataceae bacterium]MBJ7495026.1 TIGR00730 family Rossman fold protein [Gemmataceae bacterium]